MIARPGWLLPALVAALLLPAAAAAAPPRTWLPPDADSLAAWAAEARTRFQANTGDSIGGSNYRAYELVGQAGRRLLRALGPRGGLQAAAIKPTLDSLGLDTDVVVDQDQPSFTLLMVRNPYRFSARSVGFLCWWSRDQDLRMQGAVFLGGKDPVARVWWTGRQATPYEWAIVDHERGNGPAHFLLLRLNSPGTAWAVAQSDEADSLLGQPGEVRFADLNRDGVPEMVHWALAQTDSLFVPCSDCPRMLVERTYVESPGGFSLFDTRVVPSPYATLVTFVRFLLDNRKTEAARLVRDPAMVQKALAAGWGVKRKAGTWQVEYGDPEERWPRWLAVRFDGPQGVLRYVIHFGVRDNHWIIDRWVEPVPVRRPSAPRAQ